MSFAKAQELIRLADMASARHGGVSLEDIVAEFSVSHRTAQRMTDALEATFANVTTTDDAGRKRRWRITRPREVSLMLRPETAIEALDFAAREAGTEGRLRHARALSDLREGLLARLSRREAARTEADAEAVLSALAEVTRPGPRVSIRPEILDTITEALRGPFQLRVRYKSEDAPERVLEPHGVLLGHRTYLVARDPAKGDLIRTFRLDQILSAEVLDESFAMDPAFSMERFAAQSFGVWQDPAQFGSVVWRFASRAAERAAGFRFHPSQRLEWQDDGSLIVRFEAAGWLEMAWHLYQWGDTVEVLEPEGLRALVEGHRRADFGSMP
ncbi:WYL domain-containing protein [Rhodobacter capsulatus]|uniref:helix-turn-helix transcriptional regulator n=1 Tax=Rhodobacter capsulatus TaxID=1061 RepID=UPI0006DD0E2D|nr:WYL domain-containing protein [Rhodobacter capsulatus]KQB12021.1 DeoR family transcriptional regulator [Rhodobacter capsulatus]KQB16224.1 DeoR family transcriptional regulator [Rhodobacter capsulatus]PZX21182.1 putative DNA-binding transcriptional regulator YafY [Rhodobacter capsulatus]QNR62218.1 WYL domain-containing protein [Rhodobacter capsulatus]